MSVNPKHNKMQSNRIYADYNATSPIIRELFNVDATKYVFNPSSVHFEGREANSILNNSKNKILDSLNASHMNLVFTSCGTEANNLACNSFSNITCIVSSVEHPSILNSARNPIKVLVRNDGIIDINNLESILKNNTNSFVSIMLANNETGIIQPIKTISSIVHKYGSVLHTDATQGLGRININVKDLQVDMMTITGHKIGAGFGAAALLYDNNIRLKQFLMGGNQQNKIRAGTENVRAIMDFAKCVEYQSKLKHVELVNQNRDLLESLINRGKIIGSNSPRIPNTTCILMPNVDSNAQVINFDINGIAISNGSACSSGSVQKSHVLSAMGEINGDKAIRISIGLYNKKEEIYKIAECWNDLYERGNSLDLHSK